MYYIIYILYIFLIDLLIYTIQYRYTLDLKNASTTIIERNDEIQYHQRSIDNSNCYIQSILIPIVNKVYNNNNHSNNNSTRNDLKSKKRDNQQNPMNNDQDYRQVYYYSLSKHNISSIELLHKVITKQSKSPEATYSNLGILIFSIYVYLYIIYM